jgi:Fe2+ or Zn2+ uptake regulation protein
MKQAIDHAIIVLEKAGDYVPTEDLASEIQTLFPKIHVDTVFRQLKKKLFIGYDKEKGFKWFDWEKQSDFTKELIILNDQAGKAW